MNTLTNRKTWTDEDFRIIFTFFTDIREVLKDPATVAEYAPVMLGDLERAANALLYIARGTGAQL